MSWDTNHHEYEGGGSARLDEKGDGDDQWWQIKVCVGHTFEGGRIDFVQNFVGMREEAIARADAVHAALKLAHGSVK